MKRETKCEEREREREREGMSEGAVHPKIEL